MTIEIQTNPVSDSPNNDAFEAIVEVYYQTSGYITSAGKWFWVKEEGRRQRGYQDIDVLAVNGKETVIVSVTSNLDDKVNTQAGNPNKDRLDKLAGHFNRVQQYLNNVSQYQWMVSGKRTVRYVVAYNHAFQTTLNPLSKALKQKKIDLLSAQKILESLKEHAAQKNLKIQNQLLRTIQLLGTNTLLPSG